MTDLIQRGNALIVRLRSTKETVLSRGLALVAARLGLAWIFVYHGGGTLFGAFGGPGFHRSALFYSNTAHLHPGALFAAMGGSIEFLGGIAIGLGLLGRLAGAALVGDMVMAMITVTWSHGIVGNATGSGYEVNVVLACLALVVAFLGTGQYSVDAYLRQRFAKPAAA